MGRPVDIAALVRGADAASGDAATLGSLTGRCWPRTSDATSPAARAWVRLWRPQRLTAEVPECACSAGTCGWCN